MGARTSSSGRGAGSVALGAAQRLQPACGWRLFMPARRVRQCEVRRTAKKGRITVADGDAGAREQQSQGRAAVDDPASETDTRGRPLTATHSDPTLGDACRDELARRGCSGRRARSQSDRDCPAVDGDREGWTARRLSALTGWAGGDSQTAAPAGHPASDSSRATLPRPCAAVGCVGPALRSSASHSTVTGRRRV